MADAKRPTRAVLLDAHGTTIELEPPWLRLGPALGIEPGDPALIAAVRAEMDYFRRHTLEGRDADSVADLRRRCAELLSSELGRQVSVEQMLDAIRFAATADAAPALARLRELGMRLVCVSNWDCSLGEVLERCGLAGHFDAVVNSAEVGAHKPDPAPFLAGLEAAGCAADQALHIGDTADEDIAGAAAAGIRALLLDRGGGGDIASLAEIEQHLAP